jgi:mannose-1-phosphate guanylyltransferase
VLAAGRSTRIEPLSAGRPKPLLEVGGRSLLEWNLRWLMDGGMTPIWVNLHYRADEVSRAIRSMDLPGDVRFSHEDAILGTAGAWRKLAVEWDAPSLVVYGDNLTRFDLAAFRAAHRVALRSPAVAGLDSTAEPAFPPVLATVALYDPARHANTGIAGSRVVVNRGRVAGFEELRGGVAGSALVNTGAYVLEPALAERIEPGFSDFGADVFPLLVRDRALAAHVIEDGGFCLGLDTPEHFRLGEAMVARGTVRLEPGR